MSDQQRQVGGDVVHGDKYEVGNITGAQAVAIGRGAQAIVNITELSKSDRLEQRNRGILLGKIQSFWIEEVFTESLQNAEYILVDRETVDSAVYDPLRSRFGQHQAEEDIPLTGMTIKDIFDQSGRSLLILGDAGSGKTTTLLRLTDFFVSASAGDLNEPIPILFNLASWQPELSLEDWLIHELNGIYTVPRATAAQWIKEAALLILLDGMDELPFHTQADCVKAINAFRQTYGMTSIAVACREDAYYQLPGKLSLNHAIRIRPLTPTQIERVIGEKLVPLREAIASNPELAQMATNFFLLRHMIQVALDGELESLLGIDEVRDRIQFLMDCTEKSMLGNMEQTVQNYNLSKSDRWLAWLATRMIEMQQSVFLLERIQHTWLKPLERLIYRFVLSLILLVLFSAMLLDYVTAGGAFSAISLIVVIFASGTIAWTIPTRPIEVLRWSFASLRKNLLKYLAIGALIGFVYGTLWESSSIFYLSFERGGEDSVCAELIASGEISPNDPACIGSDVSFIDYLYFAPRTGLLFAGVGALFSLVFAGLRSEQVGRSNRPNFGIRRSGYYAFVVGIGFGVIAVAVDQLTLAGNALVMVIPPTLYFGGMAYVQHFIIRGVLVAFGHTPIRYVHFLDTAKEQGILRSVGGGYIFTHRSTLHHFADLSTEDDLIPLDGFKAPDFAPEFIEESPVSQAIVDRLHATAIPATGGAQAHATPIAPIQSEVEFIPSDFNLSAHRLELEAGDDLIKQLQMYAEDNAIQRGLVLHADGAVSPLMMAPIGSTNTQVYEGVYHLVALNVRIVDGVVSGKVILADKDGHLVAGQAGEGCIIAGSAELVIGAMQG